MIRIDDNGVPYYRQLIEQLKTAIQDETYNPGDLLPSKRSLSRELSLSLNTIQNAYAQLEAEGYVITRERRGTYVSELIPAKPAETKTPESPLKKKWKFDFSPLGVEEGSFPDKAWEKAVRKVLLEAKGYAETPSAKGDELLRRMISKHLSKFRGFKADPDNILITSGTEYSLQLLFRLFQKPKIYAVENPGFERLSLLFKSQGAPFIPIDLDSDGLNIEKLYSSPCDIACVTPSHQFPTGIIMPLKRRMQLMDWASEAAGRFLIEDDYDSDFHYRTHAIPALKSFDPKDRVIYMGSFSKSLSPALRVSFMVLPKKLMKIFEKNFSNLICQVSLEIQQALALYLKDGSFLSHLNRRNTAYRKKHDLFLECFRNQPVTISGDGAGVHVLLSFKEQIDVDEMTRLAAEEGIRVYPLSRFYEQNYYRIDSPSFVFGFTRMPFEQYKKGLHLLMKAWHLT